MTYTLGALLLPFWPDESLTADENITVAAAVTPAAAAAAAAHAPRTLLDCLLVFCCRYEAPLEGCYQLQQLYVCSSSSSSSTYVVCRN
jgi:hypothetical protein